MYRKVIAWRESAVYKYQKFNNPITFIFMNNDLLAADYKKQSAIVSQAGFDLFMYFKVMGIEHKIYGCKKL